MLGLSENILIFERTITDLNIFESYLSFAWTQYWREQNIKASKQS